jgi:hypothetical protein
MVPGALPGGCTGRVEGRRFWSEGSRAAGVSQGVVGGSRKGRPLITIIAVYNSEGCVGRCDSTCHNAASTHCECICGGRYHGKGRTPGALDEERAKHGNSILEDAKRREFGKGRHAIPFAQQQTLFEL